MKQMLLSMVSLIVYLCLFVSSSYAIAIEINEDCRLRHAITAANVDKPAGGCPAGNGADVIRLSEDITLDSALPTIDSEITIEADGHTIDGAGLTRIFHILSQGNLTLVNLTLSNGQGRHGGAIYNQEGTLAVYRCTLSGHTATHEGGVIYNLYGSVDIRESYIKHNQSQNWGGAIASVKATVTIMDSEFSNNSAAKSGGAIASYDGSTLTISGTKFSANSLEQADGFGGAISNFASTLDISASEFAGNAALYGAALYSEGEVSIRQSSFSDHTTDGYGGAIHMREGTLSLVESNFHDNKVDGWGGAVFNRGGDLDIARSDFLRNSASNGGAIYGEESAALAIRESSFRENSAQIGGAIQSRSAALTVSGSKFDANSGWSGGGAISSENGSSAIDNSDFSYNLSDAGAAIRLSLGEFTMTVSVVEHNGSEHGGSAILISNATAAIERSALRHNRADVGGAITSRNARVSISHSSLSSNQADAFAGAIYGAGGLLVIETSNISHNTARIAGGISTGNAALAITNSTLHGNSASEFYGGALHISGRAKTTLVYVTVADNTAEQGGGIYVDSGADVSIHNSIIADSPNGGDCYGELTALTGSLIQDGTCDAGLDGDPMLGNLVAPDDGAPAYFPLLAGSPAVDAVNCDMTITIDQIGRARPQGEGCDMGAIEYVPEVEKGE